MFHFLLGVAFGVAGTLYYAEGVRQKVHQTNEEIRDLIVNRIEFKRAVYKEIQRMQASGELEDVLYHRNPSFARQNIIVQDERKI